MEDTTILAPIRQRESLEGLVDAGAGEFYFGWVPPTWLSRYGYAKPMNQRQYPSANFHSLDEVSETVRAAHDLGARMRATLNSHSYSRAEHDLLIPAARELASVGVDAFIVSDLALLARLAELDLGPSVDVSCGAVIMNSAGIQLVRSIGADRVILPRDVLVSEVAAMRRDHPDVELEVFALDFRCFFVDGLCTTLHNLSPSTFARAGKPGEPPPEVSHSFCHDLFSRDPSYHHHDGTPVAGELLRKLRHNHQSFKVFQAQSIAACSLCAVRKYMRMGVRSLKVVGRTAVSEQAALRRRVGSLHRVMELAMQHPDQRSFVHAVQASFTPRSPFCRNGVRFGCYQSDAMDP